ncbi:MAG TPA: YceI family protein [Solirubrobacteraceae bacterium]|nr:YceI family protein [Solirubrobacteraceae bacterium]
MGGIYAVGIHRLGPDNATLSVHTKRGGAAAKAGHDLELQVTSWQATLDLDAGSAELTADATSLRVRKGSGGMQALGDEDKANIHQTIDDEVLARQNVTFRSTRMERAEDGSRLSIEGDLTLAGTTQPIAFDVAVGDDGTLRASAVVTQTRWGMKPYSALFGALKVLDDVEVVLEGHL